MRRFSFALEKVLKHKERRERLAEMRQLRSLAALRIREQAEVELRMRWEQAGAHLMGGPKAARDVAHWLVHFRHAEKLAREMAAAATRVREAARAVEEATAERRQRAREAEALRRLRHRQHEQHLEAMAKAEQRFLDEEGLRRWRESANSPLNKGSDPR